MTPLLPPRIAATLAGRGRRTALTLLALLLTPLLFFGGPDATSPRLFASTWSLGHLLLFGLLAVLLCERLPRTWPWWRLWLVILGVAGVAGGLAEMVQGGFGRTPSLIDWSWDLLGAAIGLATLRVLPPQRWARALLTLAVATALAAILIPRVLILADDIWAWRRFPVLSDLESPLELSRWRGRDYLRVVTAPVHDGRHSLEVQLPPGKYSGTHLAHFPRDWRGYRTLEMYVFNPATEPLELTVKIFDQQHDPRGHQYSDRYNGVHPVEPGWNRIAVPLETLRTAPRDREMDLARIRGVQLFIVELKEPRVLYLDGLRLLK